MNVAEIKKALDSNGSLLVIEKEGSTQKDLGKIVKLLSSKPVIYISLVKPFKSILDALKKEHIKTEKVFFIDAVTELSGDGKREENVLFIQSPADLTGIGISISQFLKTIPGEKYVLIDSLKVLAIYNSENVILRFVQSIVGVVSKNNAKLLAITTDGKGNQLIKDTGQFFDKVMGEKGEEK